MSRSSARHRRDETRWSPIPGRRGGGVGYPHDIKGQGIYAYVTLRADEEPSDPLRVSWSSGCAIEISPIAAPDLLQWAPNLPKTRSGKIMAASCARSPPTTTPSSRRLDPGRPAVVDDLVDNRDEPRG